jgi:hypothetical protein
LPTHAAYGNKLARVADVAQITRGHEVYSPLDLWKLFFTDDIIKDFVDNTNNFAKNTKAKYYTPIDVKDMNSFFACLYLFGINNVPHMRDAWSNEMHALPLLEKIMSRYKFEMIMSNWHWCDTSMLPNDVIKAKNNADPFWSVTDLVDVISNTSESLWQLGQAFDVDEQCIPMKGRHKAKCFNPKKPFKFHFKMFCLNDSLTGYQWKFFLYRGKDEQRPMHLSATTYPVWKLTHLFY